MAFGMDNSVLGSTVPFFACDIDAGVHSECQEEIFVG